MKRVDMLIMRQWFKVEHPMSHPVWELADHKAVRELIYTVNHQADQAGRVLTYEDLKSRGFWNWK